MSEDSKKLAKREAEFDVLSGVGRRLVDSHNPQEVVLWTQVRGEILRQQEEAAERKHSRDMEKTQLYGKLVFSLVAMLIGIGLIYAGFAFAGFFALGAGLFWLAPDFVSSFFNKFRPKGWNGNE
jgi:small-conductance mechanosensitive channel